MSPTCTAKCVTFSFKLCVTACFLSAVQAILEKGNWCVHVVHFSFQTKTWKVFSTSFSLTVFFSMIGSQSCTSSASFFIWWLQVLLTVCSCHICTILCQLDSNSLRTLRFVSNVKVLWVDIFIAADLFHGSKMWWSRVEQKNNVWTGLWTRSTLLLRVDRYTTSSFFLNGVHVSLWLVNLPFQFHYEHGAH